MDEEKALPVEERAVNALLAGTTMPGGLAQVLGVPIPEAQRALRRGLAGQRRAMRQAQRWRLEVECARLDALQHAVWKVAQEGDLKAIELVMKIMERRWKLLEVPAGETPAAQKGLTDEQCRELCRRFAALPGDGPDGRDAGGAAICESAGD